MKIDWRWVAFQIGVPLFVPTGLAALFVGAQASLDPKFVPHLDDILDLTPWAIIVYSMTLIGATFDRSWPRLDKHGVLWLCLAAAANAVYYALLIIRRHDSGLVMPTNAYYVTVVLMIASIVVCYRAR